MKKLSLLVIIGLVLLAGCSKEPIDEPIIPDPPKEYEKDEEGFYILEDNYFANTSKSDKKQNSYLRYYEDIPEEREYKQMRLYALDKQIPLYNTKVNISHTWHPAAPNRVDNAVGVLELEGVATFKLQCNFLINNEVKISPLNRNVAFSIDEARRVVTFTIKDSGAYTIEFRSNRVVHLFINEYKQYDEYKKESNLIYFPPGIHTAANSPYIDNDNYIRVKDNQTILVDFGATIEGGFLANNAKNFKIVGSGIISGANFERNADKGTRFIPYDFNFCSDFEIKGITTLDPAGWCYNIYFCKDVLIDNVKIISSRSNGDGISLQSCEGVTVTDCFVRSWDDSLVVKNYPVWSTRAEGSSRNISFSNCILWTDLAQSMEIGFETLGVIMQDIIFEDITVINNFHKPVISIHNGNNANIKDVVFRNITIENAKMGLGDGWPTILEFTVEFSSTWSTNHGMTSLGSISDILVSNVKVIKGINNPKIAFRGSVDTRTAYKNSVHYVSNITIEDFSLYGNVIDSSYANLQLVYANNINFYSSGKEITGASYAPKFNSGLFGTEWYVEAV